jgi:hypothetical protein
MLILMECAEMFVRDAELCHSACIEGGMRIPLLQARVTHFTLFYEMFLLKRQLFMFVYSVLCLRFVLLVRIV